MTLNTLDILLIIIAVAAIAAAAYMFFRRRTLLLRASRRFDRKYSAMLREADSEIERLNIINYELKNKSDEPKTSTNAISVPNQLFDLEKIAAEQKKLEAQQQELADRNKQLWDMSVSIEKERQHIQLLKNEIEEQHRAVTSSIKYAKLIQDAVLPSEEILKESFMDVFLFWKPRDIVSGDFYWMKRIGDTVIFTVADCT
ncbi:MAG: hypothetical protein J6T60_14235, partial [Bacteroidales bacterium]|nr:hypothetical protein [Bacteroidales bacterium]